MPYCRRVAAGKRWRRHSSNSSTKICKTAYSFSIRLPRWKPLRSEALAKLEGFTYAPSEVRWWRHGHSSERDFIYVTTQNLSSEQLQALSDEVGSDRSLLVCCAAFHGVTAAKAPERWPNLTLKKIPKMVLARCEWGRDDYSLNVANLPMAQVEQPEPAAVVDAVKTRARKTAPGQGALFEENE